MEIQGTSLDPLLFWKPGQSVRGALRFASSGLATALRFGSGAFVGSRRVQPERHLILYEREGCPYSRKVREALSVLDLDADVRPCPKGSETYRQELRQYVHVQGRIPVLLDPNTAQVLEDSDRIVAYLFRTYGDGNVPWSLRPGVLTDATSRLASLVRGNAGQRAQPRHHKPERPLELWSYEASPYSRFVREVLTELELPYVLHNAARKSPRRGELFEHAGTIQLPYLEDPNTGAALLESDAIVSYLRVTYGPEAAPN